MKKFAAIILVIALSVMFTTAFAATETFGMAAITDLEGNTIYNVLVDNTVIDAEGNPADNVPYITLVLDDETLTFEMSTETESVSGTIEVLEIAGSQTTLQLVPEQGPTIVAVYSQEDGQTVTLVDEANGMMFVMYPEAID